MSTTGLKFLRGYQVTDASGAAQFTSIYPGWYQGRTVHYHFKIRTDPDADAGYEFTSQLYFDDTLTDQIFTGAPYNTKSGQRDTTNATDMHYANGGELLLLTSTESSGGDSGTFPIALDLSNADAGDDDGFSQGGVPGGPGGAPPSGSQGG